MKLKLGSFSHSPVPALRSAALVLWLSLSVAAPLWAQSRYLASGKPDGVALLAPPPAAGSVEAAADLAEARAVFTQRTPAEEAQANKDASLAFTLFAPAIGSGFDLAKLPKTEALLRWVRADIQGAIDAPKNHWKRQRPYQLDAALSLGHPEPSYGYPSGHSTRGTVYAGVLAELFPEKKEAILAVGRQIGWDRVIIAKHFPTDVVAGRVLGQAIVRELLASPAFQHDFAEAKAEVEVAQSTEAVAK